jgi:hypothetical protein
VISICIGDAVAAGALDTKMGSAGMQVLGKKKKEGRERKGL